jgi:hypothetical protein
MNAQEQASGIQRVSWLQGCWECKRDGQTIEEQWMRPLGGSMLGMSRTVRGTALAEYELVVLREDADRLAYEAHPSGQAAAAFKSTLIVKRYESEKAAKGDSWRHERITLKPANPDFEPIVLTGKDEGELQVIAEFLEVLPGAVDD